MLKQDTAAHHDPLQASIDKIGLVLQSAVATAVAQGVAAGVCVCTCVCVRMCVCASPPVQFL
jgi:hypothetical protein